MSTHTPTQDIHEAHTPDQIHACFPVMKQLRPHLTEEIFLTQVQRQIAAGYHLIYLVEDNLIMSVLGYRIQEYLAWGKILYIDDLSTASTALKKGYATQLLQWTFHHAASQGCAHVHLDSGPSRHTAHRLYLNQGFTISSHHFSKVII